MTVSSFDTRKVVWRLLKLVFVTITYCFVLLHEYISNIILITHTCSVNFKPLVTSFFFHQDRLKNWLIAHNHFNQPIWKFITKNNSRTLSLWNRAANIINSVFCFKCNNNLTDLCISKKIIVIVYFLFIIYHQ